MFLVCNLDVIEITDWKPCMQGCYEGGKGGHNSRITARDSNCLNNVTSRPVSLGHQEAKIFLRGAQIF